MPKLTLLSMTQSILSDMDSDEVNSIDDTVESAQVASILRDTYFECINYRLWPTTYQVTDLSGLGDTLKPTHVLMDESVIKIETLRYDSREAVADPLLYKELVWMEPEDFLRMSLGRDSTDSTVQTVNGFDDEVLLIYNDKAPTYYTSFDDQYLVLDSFDNTLDSTILESKILGYGVIEPAFTITDTFVPDLPAKAFPYYLAAAKSTCFVMLRGQVNEKAELTARKQRAWLSRQKHIAGGGLKTPDFGRK
jgi:hypothetical protein